MQGIYTIKNLVTNQLYIGSAIDIDRRFKAHKSKLNSNKHKNPHLQNSWNKYGEDNFRFQVEELVESKKDLVLIEQQWIDVLKSDFLLFNIQLTVGSNLGKPLSEEAKRKLSLAFKGNKYALGHKHTEDCKKQMSLRMLGKQHALGYKHTDLAKQKVSIANKNKIVSAQTKEKQSLSHKGRVKTAEHRKNISLACKGRTPWNKGRKMNEELKK